MERSLAMVVAILGVLKAGAAYVPLDAEAPGDHLGLILEDCGARALVAQETLEGVRPPFSGPVVWMAADGHVVSDPGEPGGSGAAPGAQAGLGNLAYVIYTSGSTGRPKGVMAEHGQLASYLSGVLERMALPAGSSFAMVSTVAADLGNTVIFAALATGGCLHVISRARLSETAALARYFDRHPVDCLKIVPSHLAALLAFPRAEGCLPGRLLITGGEAVPPGLVERVRELAPGCRILNHYGPTETTVGVLTHEAGGKGARIPLGKPLSGTRVLVLDRNLAPVPAVVPGELYVGGPQVTRGYLGRPELTAEKFVPDPWSGVSGVPPGSRLYATGDRGRRLADGSIEFLGRVDFQVKIRGFRVEPGEVEAALRSHPGVGAAAVVARGQRLVAHVVARPEAPDLDGSDLRLFLRERLPDPLVPTAWVFLPALPLTHNGKVDRKALPPPEDARVIEPSAAPRTLTEEALAALWAGVLGLERVGIHESFFELGGHSLLAMQVVSRVRDCFGIELPLLHLFEAPTVAGFAAAIESALDTATVTLPPLEPFHGRGPAPASFTQEFLWLSQSLDPASRAHEVSLAWHLSGPLSVPALEAALGGLVRRHEALRTRFAEIEGRPHLEIAPAGPFALEVGEPLDPIDLIDLSQGPLLKARLAVLGADDHVLTLTVHEAAFDAGSEAVLARDLAALYEAAVEGREPLLPALPVRYADFAAWQRSWLHGPVLERLLAWWQAELQGAPTVLDLAPGRPRPSLSRVARQELEVPARSAAALLELGAREGASAFTTLLAVLQTLLHRLSGQDDLLVGTPVANRPLLELVPLIGCFAGSAVLRSRFESAETFPRRLARVEEGVLRAFSRQHTPFVELAASLPAGSIEGDSSRHPVFQVAFSLETSVEPAVQLALQGASAHPLPVSRPASRLDLAFAAREADGALRLSLEHDPALFDSVTARRILESFAALIEGIAAEPGRRLDAVPLLSPPELRELRAQAGRGAGGVKTAPRRLHDAFAAQAARRPEALAALTVGGERLTYGEIDRRSSRLARFLTRQGVGPEIPVGVCLERSPELLVALLGVLKAGGVYLPLDPAYPAERLAFMLEDSGAPLVLVRESLAVEAPAGPWKAVPLNALESLLATEEGGAPAFASRALPESLAYLIYTSGSTGRPKGAGVSHAAAAEHVEAAAGLFGFGEDDSVLCFASPSFDASVEEIFTAFARGAAIVLRDASLWSPAEILGQVVRLGVTAMDLPTAYWHQWAAGCEGIQKPPGLALRLVILGGEAMSGEAARRWWRSPLAGIPLLNAYGPTEAVITATALTVDAGEAAAAWGAVPIGHPLPGRSAWVLDRSGHPVPHGIAGELCLGGPLLARGYLGRPGLTAERFVPDPFADEPGARLYRTGDLTRFRPDGVLEFLGRADRQLKVRGFRVEPGEIESALVRHPGVREAVIDVRPDGAGSGRLVAWIVPADPAGRGHSPADLTGFLQGTLPAHMVPSAFVTLGELPLTPGGKVDLRALPAPEALEAADAAPPRNPVEERLADLWKELFGLSRIGVQDDFFDLGGHSLLAVRLLSRLRDIFGVEIPLRGLFSASVLEELAVVVGEALERRDSSPAVSAGLSGGASAIPVDRPERPPLSFSQRSLWFIDRLQPANGAYNLPTALRLQGDLGTAALASALGALVLRHEALRTRFPETDGEPWQEVLPALTLDLPVADLQELPGGPARGRGAPSRVRGGAAALRPGRRPSPARPALPAGRPRPPVPAHRPSRGERRLVGRRPDPGPRSPLPGRCRGPAGRAAAAAAPVRRLRRLAAGHPARRGPQGAARRLDEASRRRAAPRPSHRPPAPRRLDFPRRPPFVSAGSPGRRPGPPGPRPWGHGVHGPAGQPPGSARPVHRPGGLRRRHAERQPHALRAGERGRVLRQHAPAAGRPVRCPRLPRGPGPRARHGPGGFRPSESPLRAAGRKARPPARPGP